MKLVSLFPHHHSRKGIELQKNTYFFVILSYFAKRSGKKSSTCYFIRLDIFFSPSNYEDKFLFNFIIACITLCRSITNFANKYVMFLYEKKVIDYNSALQNMYHNFIFYKSMRNGMGEKQCNADQTRIRTRTLSISWHVLYQLRSHVTVWYENSGFKRS